MIFIKYIPYKFQLSSNIFIYIILVKSNCKLAKHEPGRLYPQVINICFKIFKRLVKQVSSPDRNETVPFGQAITYGSIDQPEIIFAAQICGLTIILMIVSCLQLGTQPGRVEKINTQGNTMRLYFLNP